MADRKISDLTALTTPASGDYLPIVDISETAAASKNKRITIEELFRGVPLGTAAAPSIAIEGDENTGIYSPGADQLAISLNGTGRIFIDSSGRLGIGLSNPAFTLDVAGTARIGAADASPCGLEIGAGASGNRSARIDLTGDTTYTDYGFRIIRQDQGPNARSDIVHRGTGELRLNAVDAGSIAFTTNSLERACIDSSGRLLVGTSSDSGGALLQVNDNRIRIATAKTPSSASDTGTAGEICWDANYIYVCTATNTWKRTAISTW